MKESLLTMSTSPMPGFHYVDFAESDEATGLASVEDKDSERIAQQFLYCCAAVRQWPKFRRDAIRRKRLTQEFCDQIERNVITIFREFADVVAAAIQADDLRLIAVPALRERLAHAHAYLALYAAPESLGEYWTEFSKLFDVQREGTDLDSFIQAMWEASWNTPGETTPASVTFREAREHRQQHLRDGLVDGRGRRRRVAQLGPRHEIQDSRIVDVEPSPEHTLEQFAKIRRDLIKIGVANGLTREQARFMVAMLEGKRAKDDRSAKRAINRKGKRLAEEIRAYLEGFRRRF
jgi:hypothetical protein